MKQLFMDYLNSLETLFDDFKKTIDGLPQEALDWTPGTEMNSLCVIVVHVAGSVRYWIGDILAKEDSNRDRAAEFLTRGIDLAVLNDRLDGSLTYMKRVIGELALEDLEAICVLPQDGREVTKGWIIFHVLEHVANHLGHANITRQLWDQR